MIHYKNPFLQVETMVILKGAEQDFSEQELQLLLDKREISEKMIEEEEAHLCQLRTQLMVSFLNLLIYFYYFLFIMVQI